MSTTQVSLQDVLSNPAVDVSLEMTARMFGWSKETVTTIVQVGLPMMATMAASNPELLKRMHAASQARMPEPAQEFYTHMMESRVLRQSVMDDYRATYGTMLETVHRAAARQAGTTDGQARDVIAAVLPAITQTLGQTNAGWTRRGFAKQLKDLQM